MTLANECVRVGAVLYTAAPNLVPSSRNTPLSIRLPQQAKLPSPSTFQHRKRTTPCGSGQVGGGGMRDGGGRASDGERTLRIVAIGGTHLHQPNCASNHHVCSQNARTTTARTVPRQEAISPHLPVRTRKTVWGGSVHVPFESTRTQPVKGVSADLCGQSGWGQQGAVLANRDPQLLQRRLAYHRV